MRELILLRHAEAEAGTDGKDDRERKLTEHGKRESRAAGAWLAEHHIKYDRVLCSPSQRTRETAALALGQIEPVFEDTIYDATPGDLYDLLDEQTDVERVVLVGHNPGIDAQIGSGRGRREEQQCDRQRQVAHRELGVRGLVGW